MTRWWNGYFKNPLSDGGQFTEYPRYPGKIWRCPSDVMVETNSSESTGRMAKPDQSQTERIWSATTRPVSQRG